MASSGTSLFGNFSSAQPTAKSPKSPSGTIIENPLLKGAQFSFGGSSALTTQPTSTALQTMPRSPLLAVTPNRDNIRHDNQGGQKARMSQIATPGPPPRMSLSLMGGMAMPIQVRLETMMDSNMQTVSYLMVDTKTDGSRADPLRT